MAHPKLLTLGVLMKKCLLSEKPLSLVQKAYACCARQKCGSKVEKKLTKKADPNSKVGIVLSGCGMLDGTEIHEAAAVAVHVARNKLSPVFYAPLCMQRDVIDHKTGEPMAEGRNAFVESARIARGKIKCLSELTSCEVGAVVFPGGFGAGKTLSTYSLDPEDFCLTGDVMRVLSDFKEAKKPMGFMCISAMLAARMFPCVKLTLGMKGDIRRWPHADAIEHAQQLGASIEFRPVNDFSFDKQYLVFSTPAFMYNGSYSEVFEGIGVMIDMMSKIMK